MTEEQRAFYVDVFETLQATALNHPKATNDDVMIILGRLIGLALAKENIGKRDAMLQLMMVNIKYTIDNFPQQPTMN